MPQRFYVSGQSGTGDRHVYGTVSRFLPDEVVALFERVAPDRREGPSAAASSLPTVRDIGAKLRRGWA